MDNDEELPQSGNLPERFARHADSTYGLTLRSAIASIPFVGGSVAVLVEARLAALQTARIDTLYARLAELEAQHAATLTIEASVAASPSEALLEQAATAAATTLDQDRPRVFADILFLEGAGDDRAEIVRKFLIEVMATLTRYEIALLLSHAPARETAQETSFAEKLLTLHANSPEVDDVRQFSMERLITFRLISRRDDEVQLTPVGKLLISVI